MEFRRFGQSGLNVSVVGLGGNNFGGSLDLEASRAILHKSLDEGINFIDTADIYGTPRGSSEEIIGAVLGSHRREVVIATKCGMPMDGSGRLQGGSRRYVLDAAEASLRRLKTEWIDLFYMHGPDPATPIEESLRALDDLVRAGKVRYIACSNFAAWQVADAAWTAQVAQLNRFIGAQDEYNLLNRRLEGEFIPTLQRHGLGLVPYFPLASGLLTGKYQRDAMPRGSRLTDQQFFADLQLSDRNWRIVEKLADFCRSRGRSMTELAFSWLAGNPVVASIIAGATSPRQVEQNVRATTWRLSADELAEIAVLTA